MPKIKIREILENQLQLLSERSAEERSTTGLCDLTHAMASIISAPWPATQEEEKQTLEELRAEQAKMAAAHGHTLEEEMDDLERLTHSKGYADCFRMLYGIPIRAEGIESFESASATCRKE